MATEKKKTGLGADAIFGGKKPEVTAQTKTQDFAPEAAQPAPESKTEKSPLADKVRTTVMLAPDVVVLLNRMKEKSILEGNRQTQGEIIEEAIKTLAKLNDIKM